MQTIAPGFASLPPQVAALFAAPISALLLGFFVLRPKAPRWTHVPILASCAVIAACAVSLASKVYFQSYGLDLPIWEWLVVGEWGFTFGVRVDGLSASVLAMVGVVGGLIHVYASAYMAKEEGFSRFFLAFHLFFLAMIGLLLSNNYVQLFLFWELTGLASYLLIGHWYHKASARRGAFQAFLANRLGDFGLLLALLIILGVFKTPRFAVMFQVVPILVQRAPDLVALVGVLLFWAACGKSAQFPLYFWLPDAMEGPTPVSALMHAATMVTAGIFLLARSWPLISVVSGLPELICAVGAFTAIASAIVASTKTDLKRILAYSTVSHLGIMAFALGLGQPIAAVFHLITHGFFKAVLFLCAGSIAHALHQPSAELDQVGGIRKAMPVTFACFLVAALSLAGVWPFAGFYSKDAVLDAAVHHGGWRAAAGVLIGFGSAFYIFRMLFLTFFGPSPKQDGPEHFHEAEPALAVPVCFLAVGALAAGWIHHDFSAMIGSGWPSKEPLEALPHLNLKVALLGLASAAAGAAAAYAGTLLSPEWDWSWRQRRPGLAAWIDSDFGFKTLVGWIAAMTQGFAERVVARADKSLLDAALEGTAGVARAFGSIGSRLATGSLNDSLWWLAAAAAALAAAASRTGGLVR